MHWTGGSLVHSSDQLTVSSAFRANGSLTFAALSARRPKTVPLPNHRCESKAYATAARPLLLSLTERCGAGIEHLQVATYAVAFCAGFETRLDCGNGECSNKQAIAGCGSGTSEGWKVWLMTNHAVLRVPLLRLRSRVVDEVGTATLKDRSHCIRY